MSSLWNHTVKVEQPGLPDKFVTVQLNTMESIMVREGDIPEELQERLTQLVKEKLLEDAIRNQHKEDKS